MRISDWSADVCSSYLDGGDGLRVVGGEHRVDRVGGVEQAPRAGLVGHIGIGLAREHQVAFDAVDLGALDLGVPVRALRSTERRVGEEGVITCISWGSESH